MLQLRGAPGDRRLATTLLAEARELYGTLGMRRHVALVEAMSAAS